VKPGAWVLCFIDFFTEISKTLLLEPLKKNTPIKKWVKLYKKNSEPKISKNGKKNLLKILIKSTLKWALLKKSILKILFFHSFFNYSKLTLMPETHFKKHLKNLFKFKTFILELKIEKKKLKKRSKIKINIYLSNYFYFFSASILSTLNI
jgi:hypothetical protein